MHTLDSGAGSVAYDAEECKCKYLDLSWSFKLGRMHCVQQRGHQAQLLKTASWLRSMLAAVGFAYL